MNSVKVYDNQYVNVCFNVGLFPAAQLARVGCSQRWPGMVWWPRASYESSWVIGLPPYRRMVFISWKIPIYKWMMLIGVPPYIPIYGMMTPCNTNVAGKGLEAFWNWSWLICNRTHLPQQARWDLNDGVETAQDGDNISEYGGFPQTGLHQNGWFIRDNPIKMADLGVSPF